MKKLVRLSMITALAFAVMPACNQASSDQEEQIARLEERIKELESGKNAAVSNNPTSAAANVEEVKPDGPLPEIKFEEEEYDFGTIDEGAVVEHTFSFTNTGEAPLVIQSATASCGCTVPKKPTDPIPVGETGEIAVRFNSKGKSGIQSPIITIRANTYPNVTRVKLKGTVNKAVAAANGADGPVRN